MGCDYQILLFLVLKLGLKLKYVETPSPNLLSLFQCEIKYYGIWIQCSLRSA